MHTQNAYNHNRGTAAQRTTTKMHVIEMLPQPENCRGKEPHPQSWSNEIEIVFFNFLIFLSQFIFSKNSPIRNFRLKKQQRFVFLFLFSCVVFLLFSVASKKNHSVKQCARRLAPIIKDAAACNRQDKSPEAVLYSLPVPIIVTRKTRFLKFKTK